MSEVGGGPSGASKQKKKKKRAAAPGGDASSQGAEPSLAAAAVRLDEDAPPPGEAEMSVLQAGVGNQAVAEKMEKRRSKGKGEASASSGSGSGSSAAPVAAPPLLLVEEDDDQDAAVAVAAPAPVLGAATAAQAAGELAAQWKMTAQLAEKLFGMTRDLIDSTIAAATKKKHRKQLTKERAKIDAAEPALMKEIVTGYRDTTLCEMDLDIGLMGATNALSQLQALHQQILTTLIRGLMDAAKLARSQGDTGRAAIFINDAQQAEQMGGELPGGGGDAAAPASRSDQAADATTYADTANNVGPGVIGGTIGGIEAGTEAISAASTAFGGVFAGLGIVFGSIGVALGVKASIRGASKQKKLEELHGTLESDELADATSFAANKKRKKKEGGKATAVAGGLAVGAGIAGLVAISVSTLGIGAAILGVGAALIGLGFLIGKAIHKHRKRKRYAEAIANALVDAANDPATAQEAIPQLQARGFDTATLGTAQEAGQLATLVETLRAEGVNRRDDTARTVYEAMVGRDVSEQVDAERIVETLGLSPEELRSYPPAKAQQLIARKMSSW